MWTIAGTEHLSLHCSGTVAVGGEAEESGTRPNVAMTKARRPHERFRFSGAKPD